MAVSTVNDDKKKALNPAIAQLEKNCGKGAGIKPPLPAEAEVELAD